MLILSRLLISLICRNNRAEMVLFEENINISILWAKIPGYSLTHKTGKMSNLATSEPNSRGMYFLTGRFAMRQIGAFRFLKSDCTKVRHLRIVKFVIFESLILSNCESTCDLTDGPASIYDKKKFTPDLLTLFTTFYDVSVLFNLLSKAEMCQFGASGNQPI